MAWKIVASVKDVNEGNGISVVAPGRKKAIAIFRSGGQFFAVSDECPHAYAPLSDSHVENFIVTCKWHGAQFDIRDGKGIGPLAYSDLRTFPARVTGDQVEVDV